jgi:hypothetical protein
VEASLRVEARNALTLFTTSALAQRFITVIRVLDSDG